MGRVDIPLGPQPAGSEEKQLPRCAWCGDASRTVCGRCKGRAYCSGECQQLDWRSGHQTACTPVIAQPPVTEVERSFQFYEVPYVARWAINLQRWKLRSDSKEYAFLLSRVPDEAARRRIATQGSWPQVKLALAKELTVRRMAEILTQAIWTKVEWTHQNATDRDYLLNREEYVWTGEKYQNSNRRFPNFNFSMFDTEEYLFLVTHPLAITGVYASGPLTDAMPDPREAFAEELEGEMPSESQDMESEDSRMLGPEELREICAFDSALERRSGLQHAFLGKFAYFRTIGQTRGRQWSQVVLKQHPTPDDATETPDEGTETPDGSPIVGSTRHALQLNGVLQKRWRCEVHRWRDQQLVVCRGPPEEAIDESGAFRQTQAVRFPEIDSFDKALEHDEPEFLEVPIQQLLPEKWHSDYVRACGGGERGEQTRMNYLGYYQPDIPKV
ncbi:unnamed protein product [Durusdinium trenchii]